MNPAAAPPDPARAGMLRKPKTAGDEPAAVAPDGDQASLPLPSPKSAAPRAVGLTRAGRVAICSAVVVVLAVAWGVAAYFRSPGLPAPAVVPQPPGIEDGIAAVAAFVSGDAFPTLPFERQRPYMELLDHRSQELDRAYSAGEITAEAYQRSLEYAWFGKQIPRMEKYLSLPAAEQPKYLADRLDKHGTKGHKKGGNGKIDRGKPVEAGDADGVVATAPRATPTSRNDVRRDEQSEKDIPKTWSDEWREKWKQYRNALKELRLDHEDADPSTEQTAAGPG